MRSPSANLNSSLLTVNPPAQGPDALPTAGILATFAAAMESALDESLAPESENETGEEKAEERPVQVDPSPAALVAAAVQLACAPPASTRAEADTAPAESAGVAAASGSENFIGTALASGGGSNPSAHPAGVALPEAIEARSGTPSSKVDTGGDRPVTATEGADAGILGDLEQAIRTRNSSPTLLPSLSSDQATARETGQSDWVSASKGEFCSTQSLGSENKQEESAKRTGISAAQVGNGMNGTGKMELFAAQSAVSATASENDAADDMFSGIDPTRPANPADDIPPGSLTDNRGKLMTDFGTVPASMRLPDQSEPSLPASGLLVVERIAEAIAAQAVRIRHQDPKSISLVVRPDGQTELRIELRWLDGQIEARAFLHHGDHNALESQWSDLQERLHRHGVRLSSLEQGGGSTGSGLPDHFSPRRESSPTPDVEAAPRNQPRHHQPPQTQRPARVLSRGILECYA